MRSGDVVRDGQGNTYQVGQLLGRGLWGSSFLVRRESSDSLHVLKCPLGPEDFRSEVPGSEALFAATKEAVLEQARLYEQGNFAFLPRMEARFTLADGQPAYILPRFADSLERRLADGMTLGNLMATLLSIGQAARQLSSGPGLHGNLRPSNIFFNERGEVFLTDVVTPATRKAIVKMLAVQSSARILPPEIAESTGDIPWGPGIDSYGLAALLLQGLCTGEPMPPLAREGISKQVAIHLKNRITEKLKQEESNPRFHQRMADRTVAFLSRALSREFTPSPPYRFNRLEELLNRMEELGSLIRPRIHTLGKVMLDRGPNQAFFTTDEAVSFSCTVGCSPGVEGQEEIGVGMAVYDLDRDERVKDAELTYRIDKHPSGRFRFQFGITGLSPGRFRTRLGFTIRDAGEPPSSTEVDYLVRPAAGWSPPAQPPSEPGPLPFPEVVPDGKNDAEIPTTGGTVVPLLPTTPTRTEPSRTDTRADNRQDPPSRTDAGQPRPPEPIPARQDPPRVEPRAEQKVEPARVEVPRADHREPPRAEAPRMEQRPERAEPPRADQRPEIPTIRLDLTAAKAEPPRQRPPEPSRVEGEQSRRPEAQPPYRPEPVRAEPPRAEQRQDQRPDPRGRPDPTRSSRPPQKAPLREDTPALPKRSWTQEPLPPARNDRVPDSFDDETTAHGGEDEEEERQGGLLDRVMHVFRNDPVTMLMTVLAGLIAVLLVILLIIRK